MRRELPVGPPVDHKLAREDFLKAARRAGLRLTGEPTFLPHQYFLVLEAARVPRTRGPSAVRRVPVRTRRAGV